MEAKLRKASRKRNAIALELGHDTQEGESCGSGGANGRGRKGAGANGRGGTELGFYGCTLCFDVCGVSISLVY